MKKPLRVTTAFIFLIALTAASMAWSEELVDARKLKAAKIAVQLTQLRSDRAAAFIKPDTKITLDLFKSVCGPVKKKAVELARSEGVIIRHAALKNRNPEHAATKEEAAFIHLFESNPDIKEIWDETEKDGRVYSRYILPIYVEKSCLVCHGKKGERPAFISEMYPQDRAYGFRKGDLRGIIEVLLPR